MVSKISFYSALNKSLEKLGLTNHERDLYCLSLSLGPASVAVLAEHLKISQPNIYKVIRGLETHGLAIFSNKKKYTKRFIVEPPTIVMDLIRKHQESISQTREQLTMTMPDLLALYKQGELPTKASILQGEQQIRNAFARTYEEVKYEVLYFGSWSHFIKMLSHEIGEQTIDRRVAHGVCVRGLLLPAEENARLFKNQGKELRELRTLKGAAPFTTSFHLFSNKILFWQPNAPLALLIEDEYLIAMFRSMFEWMWKRSETE